MANESSAACGRPSEDHVRGPVFACKKPPGTRASSYWDECGPAVAPNTTDPLWRAYCDSLHADLLRRWCEFPPGADVLKTDLFEEAAGDGLVACLAEKSARVTGMDIAWRTIRAARSRHRGIGGVGADARCLPFRHRAFDAVVSISTLDHFRTRAEVGVSLREIHRVLRPGGSLVLTLDNPCNPVIALRNALPFRLLNRLGLVPYCVGKTCGPRLLRRMVEDAGFAVLDREALMHVPRALAVAVSRSRRGADPLSNARFVRSLTRWEALGAWPTRFLTGNFIAIRARRL